jgi:hypothetical protein
VIKQESQPFVMAEAVGFTAGRDLGEGLAMPCKPRA